MKRFKVSGSQKITMRDSGIVETYFSEIAANKSLTMEEEQELIRRYKNGDREAANKIIKANLKFVVSVAKTYYSGHTQFMDLVSEGNIGLLKALERYDETRNFKFISYAVWWVRQSIMLYMSEKERVIRIPGNKTTNMIKVKNFVDSFYKDHGGIPTDFQICEELKLSKEEYFDIIALLKPTLSIQQKVGAQTDDDNNLEEMLPSDFFESSEDTLNREDIKKNIKIILSLLKPREADILKAHFELLDEEGNIMKTKDQLEEEYNISKTRINQLQHDVLRSLRCRFGMKRLQELLN